MTYRSWRADFDNRAWAFDIASFERDKAAYCKDWKGYSEKLMTFWWNNMVRIQEKYPSAKLQLPERKH